MFPDRLTAGYKASLKGGLVEGLKRCKELEAQGQYPEIMVIGCSDSRVAPEAVFDAKPGTLFVVSNIASLVPPWELGSIHDTGVAIEYGLNAINVKHIIVLGHADCFSIRAFVDEATELTQDDFIGKWMSQIRPIAERLGPSNGDHEAWIRQLGQAVVEHSLKNLVTFPGVRERVEAGTLALHGAYSGETADALLWRNPVSGMFEQPSKN
jgi:carbonic anhydrase